MAYRFATQEEDYRDFASGQVFFNTPGQPAFPVRLTSEIFQRCLALRKETTPVIIYDPCCGSGYHLAALGILHSSQLKQIIASDIDQVAANLATRNLSLLTLDGLAKRQQAIQLNWEKYGKQSHQAALASADRLRQRLEGTKALPTHCFVADATQAGAIATALSHPVDLVISDLPYGQLSSWQGAASQQDAIWHLLEQLQPRLHEASVVALATTKNVAVAHEQYERYGRFRHGKRMITFLKRRQA